uniref:NFATC2-interacting protein n=1 Tax=Gasterosteus aculeatus aculeatus TaxID=481459 RepID=UPI001A984020|nr:NFATC2-interacting protein [Gasterosteus aculeatus aculeatus]
MAESVCDVEHEAVKPPPKRRRILDPSAIVSVPVYSNKVSSSLQLRPMAAVFTEKDNSDDGLWARFSSREAPADVVHLSDSEDEAEVQLETTELAAVRCPSPPESPVQKQSRQVQKKISEIDRKLQAVNSFLSPEPRDRKCLSEPEEDVIVNPVSERQGSLYSSSVREIPLKIRCRTDVHKVLVLSSTRLSDVLTQLSIILDVPPPRLLLLREEEELRTDATVGELGLGIADIIECVVMAAQDDSEADSRSSVTVRLQSKDRDSSQEFSLHRDAPLGSVFSRYLCTMPGVARTTVRFHYDGSKVTDGQTPAQLDMEDGDIIEVWV